MQIETGAALAGWLATVEGPGGEPLTRDQAAQLLGLSRSALFAALNVGGQAGSTAPLASTRQAIRPYIVTQIDTLEELRQGSPDRFAALVARRCHPAGQAGRPKSAKCVTK